MEQTKEYRLRLQIYILSLVVNSNLLTLFPLRELKKPPKFYI